MMPADDDAAAAVVELEQTLFHEPRVWFYQVPAGHVSTLSPRADAWDPERPFLTGSLDVLQRGDACWIRMYEPPPPPPTTTTTSTTAGTTGTDSPPSRTLFAQCPVVITRELPLEVYVQDCADSSRYFMVRVEDEGTGRRAYLGIGFPERTSAFNFKASLQDYVKFVHRQVVAAAAGATASSSTDWSLPKGATIRINLKVPGSGGEEHDGRAAASRRPLESPVVSPSAIPLIPPPPGPTAVAPAASDSVAPPPSSAAATDEDDWGDFTSA